MSPSAKCSWAELWRRLNARGDADAVFAELAAHYAESHRAYHNLAHIADCLEQFAPAHALAGNAAAVELALWYHDVIYDPRARDNEERSAEVAVHAADKMGLAKDFAEAVRTLILATKKHDVSLAPDAAVMVDVDLSILGRAPQRFDEYERQIRQEYAWVPDDTFAAGRAAVLESFLLRPAIYATEFFRSQYEHQARANMARSVEKMKGPDSSGKGQA